MSSRSHDPYAAFRVREYRYYMLGWLIALVGTRIQSVAVGWEIYARTGQALALGYVGLVQAVPIMALAIPAGFIADRFNRRRVVVLSLLGMTLTSLGLAALSWWRGPVGGLYALLLLDSTAVALGRPARVALLPRIVPRAIFPNAVTWNTSLIQISSVLGPALGGFIIAAWVPAAYLVCAASSLVFLFLLGRIPFRNPASAPAVINAQTLLAGLRFVWRTKLILASVTLDMFAVLLGGAVFLLPIFAKDILGVGARGFGWLNAAPAAGAFCMALLMVHRPPLRRAGRALLIAVAAFGLATIAFGFSRSYWLSLAMLFLTGAFDNISMVVRHTLIQLRTPDEMRGRVSAINSVFIGASNELGGLESGVVAHFFTPVISVVSGGIGTLLVVALTAVWAPELRKLESLQDIQSDHEA